MEDLGYYHFQRWNFIIQVMPSGAWGVRGVSWLSLALSLSPLFAATATYRTLADWKQGFNGEIAISNDGSAALDDWQLEFDWDRDLDPVWNGKVIRRNANHWVIGPEEWNRRIAPGGRIVVGFSGSPGLVTAGPLNLKVGGTSAAIVEPSRVRLSLLVTVQSESGFSAIIIVSNAGNEAIRDWRLAFDYDAAIESVWNAGFERTGRRYVLAPADDAREIPVGGAVAVGLTAQGAPPAAPSACQFNDGPCEFDSGEAPPETPAMPVPPLSQMPVPIPGAITIQPLDERGEAPQVTVPPGVSRFRLSARVAAPRFSVAVSNAAAVSAAVVDGNVLEVTGLAPGRSAIRILESVGNSSRYVGVRVRDGAGAAPGVPRHLALGSVSEDTPEHLNFWRSFESGAKGRRMDYRYIYLNGGPAKGWATWSLLPGGRAIDFIRNSRTLGMIPFFVFYNIPEDGESLAVATANSRNRTYMAGWFRNLALLLDIVNRESPDDPVGILMEPDFLGYLAQGVRLAPSQIPAATGAAYDTGVLTAADPRFPDTIRGLVEAANYLISSRCAQCYFGWQMNLWASPAGGWRTPMPAKGIVRITDDAGIAAGRERIRQEASAIAEFYANAGVATRGAKFFSIDKYGLDATGFEPSAAVDPAASTWFWNADHWGNYLTFVRAASETLALPAVLWQLPVGRINRSQEENPYTPGFRFPDLTNSPRNYEDSAAAWFLGDRFVTPGARRLHFAANRAGDASISSNGDSVSWGSHMAEAAQAGVVAVLFGAGVAESTSAVGSPPTDGSWWIVKAQKYLASPVAVRDASGATR